VLVFSKTLLPLIRIEQTELKSVEGRREWWVYVSLGFLLVD